MKKSKMKSICKIILTFIQIIILIPSLILEYYATRKMGVIRYLVYKETVFSKGTFSDNMLINYKYIFIISLIISIILIIYSIKKLNSKSMFMSSLVNCFLNILAILYIIYKNSITLKINTYYYFFISLCVIIVVQYLKMLFSKK